MSKGPTVPALYLGEEGGGVSASIQMPVNLPSTPMGGHPQGVAHGLRTGDILIWLVRCQDSEDLRMLPPQPMERGGEGRGEGIGGVRLKTGGSIIKIKIRES